MGRVRCWVWDPNELVLVRLCVTEMRGGRGVPGCLWRRMGRPPWRVKTAFLSLLMPIGSPNRYIICIMLTCGSGKWFGYNQIAYDVRRDQRMISCPCQVSPIVGYNLVLSGIIWLFRQLSPSLVIEDHGIIWHYLALSPIITTVGIVWYNNHTSAIVWYNNHCRRLSPIIWYFRQGLPCLAIPCQGEP